MKTQPYKNLWDVAKAVPRGKFTAIQAFLKKKQNKTRKISKKTNLTCHLKLLEEEQQAKPKVCRRK